MCNENYKEDGWKKICLSNLGNEQIFHLLTEWEQQQYYLILISILCGAQSVPRMFLICSLGPLSRSHLPFLTFSLRKSRIYACIFASSHILLLSLFLIEVTPLKEENVAAFLAICWCPHWNNSCLKEHKTHYCKILSICII